MYEFNNQNKPTKQQTFSLRQLGLILPLLACMLYSDIAQAQLPVWNLSQKFGTDNPMNVFFPVNLEHIFSGLQFADVDGDGDYDCVTGRNWGGTSADSCDLEYFENIGTATFPIFTQRYGVDNPFDTIDNVNMPRLVDLDADGDLDLIVNSQNYQTSLPRYVWYYENTGSATNPVFVARSGTQNPFDTVGAVMNSHPQAFAPNIMILFNLVDIDNDGDLDNLVFYNDNFTDYYKNEGTATNPNFVLQTASLNPLSSLTGIDVKWGMTQSFVDLDGDNDYDLLVDHAAPNATPLDVFENTGSPGSPVFVSSTVPVLDTTYNGITATVPNQTGVSDFGHYSFVDIDGDGDLDVFELDFFGRTHIYYENLEIVLNVDQLQKNAVSLELSPNPTTGRINLGATYTGHVFVYGIAGRLLKRIDLVNDNNVDLSVLDNGTYFLVLDADKKRYQGKVVLQR